MNDILATENEAPSTPENQPNKFRYLHLAEGLTLTPEAYRQAGMIDHLLHGGQILRLIALLHHQHPIPPDVQTILLRLPQIEHNDKIISETSNAMAGLPHLFSVVPQNTAEESQEILEQEFQACQELDRIWNDLQPDNQELIQQIDPPKIEVTDLLQLQSIAVMLQYSFRHDVSNRVSALKGYLQLLARSIKSGSLTPESATKGIANIGSSVQKLEKYLDQDVPELLRDLFPHEKIPLETVIQEAKINMLSSLNAEGIQLQIASPEPGLAVDYSQTWLKPLLENIVSDQIKSYQLKVETAATPNQGDADLHPEAQVVQLHFAKLTDALQDHRYPIEAEQLAQFPPDISLEDYILIVFEDNGNGIKDEKHFFYGFSEDLSEFRDSGSSKVSGTGFGMAGLQKILEKYGGKFIFHNRTDTRGARLILALPKYDPARILGTV